MSLKDETLVAVGQLAVGTGPHTLQLHVDQIELNCTGLQVDRLACAFELLSVRRSGGTTNFAQLQQTAQTLASKLNYLLEPIAVLEEDSQAGAVQLRSQPPQRDATQTRYYEIVAKRTGELTLRRYNYDQTTRVRTPLACEVTREVFGRLVGDLAAVA